MQKLGRSTATSDYIKRGCNRASVELVISGGPDKPDHTIEHVMERGVHKDENNEEKKGKSIYRIDGALQVASAAKSPNLFISMRAVVIGGVRCLAFVERPCNQAHAGALLPARCSKE